jgi:hypothetical protein
MDDMRVIQDSGCNAPTTALVVGPREAIQMNGYNPAEGDYNDFGGAQPGGGLFSGGIGTARIYYWLPTEAKSRPTIDVYDAKGHRVRHIAGQHEVFNGTDAATSWYLSKSDGKNEFYYDLAIDGPPQYNKAPFFFLGPDDGPQLPPGHYTIAFTVDGKTWKFPLTSVADPSTTTTQAEFEAAFMQRRKEYDLLGRVDTMLNGLQQVKDDLATQKAAAKTGDAVIAKITDMSTDIDKMIDTLTSNPQSFEDSINKAGAYREDIMAMQQQETLSFASLNLYKRLEADYPSRAATYNAWVGKVAAFNTTLKGAGLKAVTVPSKAPTKPAPLSPIVTH